ncbi:MAG: D-2-hydroxyacid dehydrogenase [Rhodospirillaceae bacterium]|nr:D-2-hydroxyacid dehydrogenase [Rhodospirillaceae bacterium]
MRNASTDQRGNPKILVHSDRADYFVDRIRVHVPSAEIAVCRTYAAIADSLAAVRPEIVLTHKFEQTPYPGHAVAESSSVRWIQSGGTGVDHFRPWDSTRITVTNSAGAPRTAMAEFAIGAIYALNHYFPRYFRQQMQHEWRRGTIRMTAGGTAVVIGLGRIGSTIAQLASAVGLQVIGVRSRPEPVAGIDEIYGVDRLGDALALADYVIVIVPRTDETAGLLNEAAFARLKPGALLVDLSRGGVVREAALLDALRSGQVRGAFLDVFETEPLPADSPFWDMENVIVTPHVAGFFEGWESITADIFCDNLDRWLAGEPLRNVVDPDLGY